MLFNSYEFLFVFLPLVWLGFHSLLRVGQTQSAKGWLVLGSLVFYAWWNPVYLPLILGSMITNFTLGNYLLGERSRPYGRPVLIAGIVFNLALLGYFKYTDFFIRSLNTVLSTDIELWNVVLPLAISFFTFQQIAYLVDASRGVIERQNGLDYGLFVTFFPQLIAGPIVHHKEMMPQFHNEQLANLAGETVAAGLLIFTLGLAKKVLLADTFAGWATAGFDNPVTLDLVSAWVTSLSYSLQLYFDFSGYSDMAIGLALLFNIRLPLNFNSPYQALTLQDFWRRWHITLSRFLRDYLYIPLGGNRYGEQRAALAVLVTFTLGGLWHGASWLFVLWGGAHGAGLVIYRLWRRAGYRLPPAVAWFVTFNMVNLAWVLFRADSLRDVERIVGGMLGINGLILPVQVQPLIGGESHNWLHFGGFLDAIGASVYALPMIGAGLALVLYGRNSYAFIQPLVLSYWRYIGAGALFAFTLLQLTGPSEFLYFNF